MCAAGELAQLPSALRGFGPVRERSRADYERNRARLRNTLTRPKDQSDVLLWTEERLPRAT